MENPNIIFIGMDTHKESTDIAYVCEGFQESPKHLGKVSSRKQAMTKLVRQLQSKHPRATLHFVYEGSRSLWVLVIPASHKSRPIMLRHCTLSYS